MKLPLKITILASGSGTTANAVMKACQLDGPLFGIVEVKRLIATKEDIGAIDFAIDAQVPTSVCNPRDYSSDEEFGQNLIELFKHDGIDLFCLYGCLTKIPAVVLTEFVGVNQHPGDPKNFGGLGMYGIRVHEAVIQYRDIAQRSNMFTMVVSQFVDPKYDQGEVIVALPIPVLHEETAEELQARVLPLEHMVQIMALAKLATKWRRGADIDNQTDISLSKGCFYCHPDQLAQARQKAIALHSKKP